MIYNNLFKTWFIIFLRNNVHINTLYYTEDLEKCIVLNFVITVFYLGFYLLKKCNKHKINN